MPIDLSKLSAALKAAITTTGTISSRLPLPSAFIGLLLRSRSSRLHKIGIFGCVDSYRERDELERFTRRFLIPYIDIGMDVHGAEGKFSISGQAVLSSPGGACLWCLGILTQERITREAGTYGKAGSRPQVSTPPTVRFPGAGTCGKP